MKINSINQINSTYKKQVNPRNNNKSELSVNNVSVGFSSVSSNAIKTNALASISFKAKDIKTSEAKQREMQLMVESFNVYADVMQVFRNSVPDCAKEAKELYQLVSDDVQNVSNDKCVTIKQTIYNGEIVPKELYRKDRFGQPVYSAEFLKGKISQINAFDLSGNVSKVIKYDEETGDLISYQKNSNDEDVAYDFLIEYDSEYGISELSKYYEEPHKDDKGNTVFSKVIEYIDSETLEYKEDVVITPQGEEIEAKRVFDFENLSTFNYCSSISKAQSGDIQQGEKIRIENNNMISLE